MSASRGRGITERGHAVDRLPAHLPEAHTLRVVAGVEVDVRTGRGDRLEGRVRDEVGELALHREASAAADLDELDVAGVAAGRYSSHVGLS